MSGAVEGVALSPCPFCGSCDVVLIPQTGSVECIDCGAIGPGTLGDDCAALWNTRTTPPARSYADAIEDAAKACEDQQQVFLSPQYATGQPLSSFHERFACGQCAAAIRLLSHSSKGVE